MQVKVFFQRSDESDTIGVVFVNIFTFSQFKCFEKQFCPLFKGSRLSDNDCEPDENNSYTQASLQIGTLPRSFTICTAFMVEYWTEYTNARIYGLHDENEQVWHFVEIFAADTYTEFTIKFEGWSTYGVTSDYLFYPLQWTRVCLSMDSNSSEVQFVVEGELLVHKPIWVKKRPDNLNLTLGIALEYLEELKQFRAAICC